MAGRRKLARRSQNTQSRPGLLAALSMDVLDTARQLYPAYTWAAGATEDGGSCIELVCLEPGVDTRYGHRWHTTDIQQASTRRRAVMIACGEILERLGLERHRHTLASEVDGQRNARGELVMDLG